MTRRIVIAILMTMGFILLLSDGMTYWTIRALLLKDLDDAIVTRVTLLPQVESHETSEGSVTTDARDRYIIENDQGRNMGRRPATSDGRDMTPEVTRAVFTTVADGQRFRTLTIRAMARPTSGSGEPVPVTIVYSGSAVHFDSMMQRLILALAGTNVLVAVGTSLVVRWVSISALKPLAATAETIGAIDERNLHRRIAVQALPTELRPMAERLNEMLARLEESVQRRNRFLSDASHELRAPLAAVMTGLEVCLRRPRSADEYRQALEECLQDSQGLKALVGSLMDQVKSERFEKSWEVSEVAVGPLLAGCVRMASVLAAAKNVRVTIEPAMLPTMQTSEERLRSIVMNLLTNAVEYNRDGGSVELSAAFTQGRLQIRVIDTGCGISAEELPCVLEPFYRVDKSRKPSANHHLGLGLSLVQSHVQALGGTFSMTSDADIGTIATIDIAAPACEPMIVQNAIPVSIEHPVDAVQS